MKTLAFGSHARIRQDFDPTTAVARAAWEAGHLVSTPA
jgi:hypothetical protein